VNNTISTVATANIARAARFYSANIVIKNNNGLILQEIVNLSVCLATFALTYRKQFHFLEDVSSVGGGVVAVDEAVVVVVVGVAGVEVVVYLTPDRPFPQP